MYMDHTHLLKEKGAQTEAQNKTPLNTKETSKKWSEMLKKKSHVTGLESKARMEILIDMFNSG